MSASELKTRVVTGVAGGIVLLAFLILGGRLGASLVAVVISLGMLYEFAGITFGLYDKDEKRKLLVGIGWLVAFINFWIPRAEYELWIASFLGLFGYFLMTARRHPGEAFARHLTELAYSLFGLVYLSFVPLYLPLLRDNAGGKHWVVLFLLVVFAGDTGAYFAGRKYGKRKLYPVISPKKTIEGSIGGLLSGYVIFILYKLIFFPAITWSSVLLIPAIVGVTAQVGDLCESFVKRAFDKKDSGSILPGHGGFLDRFDGVVFSLPFMYACVRIFG